MKLSAERFPASGLALLTLLVSVGAAITVPPSHLDPGISDIERSLASTITPLLLVACALAVGAVVSAAAGGGRLAGLLGILSLLVIPIATLLSAQYGTAGASVPTAVLVTAPLAFAFAARESAWRQSGQRGPDPGPDSSAS